MNWNTQYQPIKVKEESTTKPSLVVPNEAMSIREIMIRYSRGLPIDSKVPMYDEENFLPDVKNMDLADIQTMRENIQIEIENRKQQLQDEHKQNQTKKQLEAQQRRQKEKEELLKEIKETTQQ